MFTTRHQKRPDVLNGLGCGLPGPIVSEGRRASWEMVEEPSETHHGEKVIMCTVWLINHGQVVVDEGSVCVLVGQLWPTLCDPRDCSLPVSSIHGIFQARILELVAISFSRRSSQPKDGTWASHTAGRFFTI